MNKGDLKMRKRNTGTPGRVSTLWLTVLAWITCLMLTALAAVLVLYSTLCSPSYMKSRVRASNYVQGMYDKMREDFISYGNSAGISAEVITAGVSEDKLSTDLNDAIERLYKGDFYLYSHGEVGEDTFAAIKAEAEANGVTVADDTEEALKIMAEAVRMQYANTAAIPLASQLYTFISKLESRIWIILLACAVLTAVAVELLISFGRKDPRLGVNFLLFALLGAALVCLVLGVGVNPIMRLDRLNLEPQALKALVVGYAEGILGRFTVFAVIYALLAAVLLAVLHLGARRKPKRNTAGNADGPVYRG